MVALTAEALFRDVFLPLYPEDAKSDLGVYDPYRALWYLLKSTDGFKFGGI